MRENRESLCPRKFPAIRYIYVHVLYVYSTCTIVHIHVVHVNKMQSLDVQCVTYPIHDHSSVVLIDSAHTPEGHDHSEV